jgi:uncharacterized protein with PIN domain
MGQAKLKGTFDQRQAQAKAKARSLFPSTVKCNNCASDLSDIHAMDVRGMPGMRLAGAASCSKCNSSTWIVDGTPQALQRFQEFMATQHEGEVQIGTALKPNL